MSCTGCCCTPHRCGNAPDHLKSAGVPGCSSAGVRALRPPGLASGTCCYPLRALGNTLCFIIFTGLVFCPPMEKIPCNRAGLSGLPCKDMLQWQNNHKYPWGSSRRFCRGAASQHDDRWFRSGLLSFARLMCFWRIEQRPCTWSWFQKITGPGRTCAPGTGFCIARYSGQIQERQTIWNGVLLFFFNSALLGVGLAMDAFSVSMANGLHDPRMSKGNHVQGSRAPSACSRLSCP